MSIDYRIPVSDELSNWRRCLNTVANAPSSSRYWICEIKRDGGVSSFEALSNQEYNDFYKQHSIQNSLRRKLSFKEIITISQRVLGPSVCSCTKKVSGLNDDVYFGDMFNADIKDIIMDSLRSIKEYADTVQSIPSCLDKIANRSINRRLIEKTKTIWGKIKWYIWSWFFDTKVDRLQVKNMIPSSIEVSNHIKKLIKERIHGDIYSFERSIDLPEEQFTNLEMIDSPSSVRKKWLTKYAQDKYHHPVTENADTCRKRIIVMADIWASIIKSDVPETVFIPQQAIGSSFLTLTN